MRFHILWPALLVIAVGFIIGCGDDPVDVNDNNDPQSNEQANDQNDAPPPSPDDCADDEQYNPTTGECVPAPDNGDNSSANDDNSSANDDNSSANDDNSSANDDNGDANDDNGDVNDDNGGANDDLPCGPGAIEGETCRPDGAVLPGAEVTLEGYDCDGLGFDMKTTADTEGYYSFSDVPAGQHELTITSGSFEVSDPVVVDTGQTTEMFSDTQKLCMTGTEAEIAIMEGNFDDVATMLDDMGIDYDFYPAGFGVSNEVYDFVTDLDAMLEYDIIFAECQVDLPRSPTYDQELVEENVRRFVEHGNSFYASDRADEWIFESMPEAIDFDLDVGGLGGLNSDPVEAQVVSEAMQTLLDQDTMEFVFDTNGWTIARGGGSSSTIHFLADDVPLSGSTATYDGAALIVTYDEPLADGTVAFTSFHNSAQLTDDMETILQYLFFQL